MRQKVWFTITKAACALCLQRHRPFEGGVNDVPFCLRYVLNKYMPRIEITLVGH